MHGALVGDCNAGVRCHTWRMLKSVFQITPVRTAADLEATLMLFRTYAASLDVDLAYQDFEGKWPPCPASMLPLLASCCWRVMLTAGPWAVSDFDRWTPPAAAR